MKHISENLQPAPADENPVFPTHYPEEDANAEQCPEEYFSDDLFDMRQSTITYEEKEQGSRKAFGSKVKKQAKVKKK
uniref:Uncharacterized protein n=1 Tax=Romanomermis culicivorax TaxID=13658 RepID=A0A915HNH1_ROMCU